MNPKGHPNADRRAAKLFTVAIAGLLEAPAQPRMNNFG
jgi:hypothetical protein